MNALAGRVAKLPPLRTSEEDRTIIVKIKNFIHLLK